MDTPRAASPRGARRGLSPVHREVLLSAVLAVVLTGVALGAFPIIRDAHWPLAIVLLLLGFVGELVQVQVRYGKASEVVTLMEPILVVSIVLMPSWFSLLLAFVSVVAVEIVRRRPLVKLVFNTAVYLAATASFTMVYRLVGGDAEVLEASQTGITQAPVLLALVLGSFVFATVNFYLLSRVFTALTGESLRSQLRLSLPLAWVSILGAAAFGATIVMLYKNAPVLLPLVFVTGGALLYGHARTIRAEKEVDRSAQLTSLAEIIVGINNSDGMIESFLALTRRAFGADAAMVLLGTDEVLVVEDRDGEFGQRPPTPEERALHSREVPPLGAVLTRSDLSDGWSQGLVVPLGKDSVQSGVVVVASRDKNSAFSQQSASLFASLVSALVAAQNNAMLSEQIKTITTSQAEAVLSLDDKGSIAFTNPAAEEMLGLTGVDLRGLPYREVFRLESNGVPIGVLHVATSGQALTNERAVLVVGNTQRTIQYTASPIRPAIPGEISRPGVVLAMTDITAEVEAQKALALSQERLLEAGRTLQQALLPPVLPEIDGVQVAARYHPGAEGLEIGGDFYDVFDVLEDSWMVVIGDVCGRGAEAAALTALTRHTLRAAALRENAPARLLETLNEAILRHNKDNDRFCTVAAARLRLGNSPSLTVSCAGHPAPLLVRSGEPVTEIGPLGTLLGLFPDVTLAEEEIPLRQGDVIVFYTDGVSEARNAAGEQFGEGKLVEVLQNAALLPASEVARRLDDALTEFRGGPNDDDTAFVVLSLS